MYVILDVIYNHSGSNWFYRDEWDGSPKEKMPYRFSSLSPSWLAFCPVGESIPQPISMEDGVFPEEFQNPDWYNRAGMITHWEALAWEDPMNPPGGI
jgi:hypothetical protein